MSDENKTRTYRFGGNEIEASINLSPEQVRMAWAEVYPGLENAMVEERPDGSVDFTVRAGTKG